MKQQKDASKPAHFFHQVIVIALVLFVSKIIESFMPIPMPASVIGLVLLFVLLCTGAVKLGEVEKVGTSTIFNHWTNNRLNNTITYLYWLCHTNYYESYFEI